MIDWCLRWQKILKRISIIEDSSGLERVIVEFSQLDHSRIVAFVNAHAMNMVAESSPFCDSLLQADVVFRDGSGMAGLYRMLGMKPGLNLNGTDLIPRIVQAFNARKIALFGTVEPYLGHAKEHLLSGVARDSRIFTMHGFHSADDYLAAARDFQPSLIVLGMGMPKQEQIACMIRNAIEFPCVIICGGAIIDFLGGRFSRAPKFMRMLGMEWAYRLLLEPRRLFRRYVIGNPLFLLRCRKFRKAELGKVAT